MLSELLQTFITCMSVEDIKKQWLMIPICNIYLHIEDRWLQTRNEIIGEMKPYWPFHDTDASLCTIISLCMCTYWIILISTLISNVPICKFKYQSMSDHYAAHYLFDHYTDYHLSDHHANIIQLSKLSSCIILNILNIKRNLHVKCISHCICYSIVKILYIGKGKEVLGEELRCSPLCTTTMHIELYVCILLLVTLKLYM